MAMDALKNLTGNIPRWQKRLEELSGQIEKRQAELAAFAVPDPFADTRSLRNKGSTESLRPRDDEPLRTPDPPASPVRDSTPRPTTSSANNNECVKGRSTPTPPNTGTDGPALSPGAVLHKHARDAMFAAHTHEQIQQRKRQRAASVTSSGSKTPVFRTRSMIIVYYDSYVQGFFDELVRFVSSSRNLLRKAKTAAKVAQIKRMAEAEGPDGENGTGEAALPSLRYMSPRSFGSPRAGFGPPGLSDHPPDAYDKLDKQLDSVQATCEHGAHQFLRDANCSEEIAKIQKRIAEVLEMAVTETERVEREEPELAKETGCGRVRMRRPISMRRELTSTTKGSFLAKDDINPIETAVPLTSTELSEEVEAPSTPEIKETPGPLTNTSTFEGDVKIEADEGVFVDAEIPKLEYRSTRRWARARQVSEQ